MKNNVAFTTYVLHKELKGLSGVLQKNAWNIDNTGQNFFQLLRNLGGSILEQWKWQQNKGGVVL